MSNFEELFNKLAVYISDNFQLIVGIILILSCLILYFV
jgi:hypothetical protein